MPVCDAGFTLQLDEHQLKNILKDIHVKYAAETMEALENQRDDLVNFKQFVWLINGAVDLLHSRRGSAPATNVVPMGPIRDLSTAGHLLWLWHRARRV
eukprot:COSAG03_NODE_1117_length_4783_cov_5.636635_6_plen_98_part_00